MRWRDEQMKKIFWVQTCIKPNLVLSEISEMKRWTDEENFLFGSEHVSSQIWCYLKLVRWRDEEWDEEIKKIFLVQICIKPNLVLSEISEMKRWRVRWRDEKKIFWVQTCIKPNLVSKIFPFIGPNLVLSEISEMKRWRVRGRDEQMKKIFWVRTCIKPNLVLSEIRRWRDEEWDEEMKIFLGLNMYQAKFGVIWKKN